MKFARVALYLALGSLLAACAYVPPGELLPRVVSPDYTASGPATQARAYVYGKVTVLEFETPPALLLVVDDQGRRISSERAGRFFRLPFVLDHFTAWADGEPVTFAAIPRIRIFAAPVAVAGVMIGNPVKVITAPAEPDEVTMALQRLCDAQLAEVRALLEVANKTASTTGEELFTLDTRLRQVHDRMFAGSAVVRVMFPTGRTSFDPSPSTAAVLIANAKRAARINIAGRTDARVAGPLDSKIAFARAEAARAFLMHSGIDAEKIHVSSQASGDFIAPNNMAEGRAVNRRVDVELVATLKQAGMQLTAGTK